MAENPKVTSKFDRMHGHPRQVHPVNRPGGATFPDGAGHEHEGRSMPVTRSEAPRTTARVHYHPNEHGRMDRGERAVHPTHEMGRDDYDGGED